MMDIATEEAAGGLVPLLPEEYWALASPVLWQPHTTVTAPMDTAAAGPTIGGAAQSEFANEIRVVNQMEMIMNKIQPSLSRPL